MQIFLDTQFGDTISSCISARIIIAIQRPL